MANTPAGRIGKEEIADWVDRYADDLYAWAFHKTHDSASAQDLVQDTFLAALKSASKFKMESQPKTWLIGILNNKIADFYKKKARHWQKMTETTETIALQITEQMFDSQGNWAENTEWGAWTNDGHLLDNPEFLSVMDKCMDDLPPNWRLAVLSKYIHGNDAKATCLELNISQTNYWQVIHRAKLMLKKCIDVHWH